jgi:crotonobetainyl-CoA:carnitine CoA-transferase CaiB-like acyl-CoA transferase
LSQIRAGPKTARWLADAGAEVIKLESFARPDRGALRRLSLADPPIPEHQQREHNRYAGMGTDQLHRDKLGLALDLKTDTGKDLFKRLIAISDVVIENFSAGVMDRLGLGYDTLSELRRELIMLSMPAFGSTGPYRDHVGFGWGLEHQSGISGRTGYLGGQPLRTGTVSPDPLNGLHGATAVMAALVRRARSGEGQFIELAHWESTLALVGDWLLEHAFNNRSAGRIGNRHPVHAPQGCYRCAGDDEWVVLTVTNGEEWSTLCSTIDRPDLETDARFATAPLRQRNHDELDAILEPWTRLRTKIEAMELLQHAGVRAGAVFSNEEALTQPQFAARGFLASIEHPDGVAHPYMNGPWQFSRTPMSVERAAPLLGEHNAYVLGELLGLSTSEQQDLESSGVTATFSTSPSSVTIQGRWRSSGSTSGKRR